MEPLASKRDSILIDDDLRAELAGLKQELVKWKTDIIKWMFIFWIGQVAVTFGFILLFLNN